MFKFPKIILGSLNDLYLQGCGSSEGHRVKSVVDSPHQTGLDPPAHTSSTVDINAPSTSQTVVTPKPASHQRYDKSSSGETSFGERRSGTVDRYAVPTAKRASVAGADKLRVSASPAVHYGSINHFIAPHVPSRERSQRNWLARPRISRCASHPPCCDLTSEESDSTRSDGMNPRDTRKSPTHPHTP